MRLWITCGVSSLFLVAAIAGEVSATIATDLKGNNVKVAASEGAGIDRADQLYQQGVKLDKAGQFDEALPLWQEALALYQSRQQMLQVGQVLRQMSEGFEAISNYEQSIFYGRQYRDLAKSLKNQQMEAEALNLLGVAHRGLGDYDDAFREHKQALAIAIAIGDKRSEGNALGNIGMDYHAIGKYKEAIEHHQKRLAIAIEIQDHVGRGNAMSNLGNAYRAMGDFEKARLHHQQRLEIAIALKDKRAEGQALGFLGLVYRSLGQFDKSIMLSQQGLAIAQKIGDRQGEARSFGYLGSAYYARSQAIRRTKPEDSQADYETAIDFHRKSLMKAIEIRDRRSQGKSYGYLGAAYESRGDYVKAIQAHEQSLIFAQEVKDLRGQGKTLTSLGIAYDAIGRPEEAVQYHRKSIAIRQQIKDRLGEGMSWQNLGMSLMKQNQLPEAEQALQSALTLWESLRSGLGDSNKISLAETQAAAYSILQEILVRQHRTEAALEVAERGRARAFAELLARKLGRKATIDIAPPNLQSIRAIAQQQNATLVEYSIINAKTLYIWVVKPTGEVKFYQSTLNAKQPIRELIAYSRGTRATIAVDIVPGQVPGEGQAQNAPEVTIEEGNQLLYQQLIAPIASDLPTDPNARIIFLPQGELFLVPFPALQNAQGKYLIQSHTISTAPSIQTLQLTHEKAKRPNRTGQALVVGNPTMPLFNNQPLDDLPGAKAEAIAISTILKTQPLLGAQATKAAVLQQMSDAPIIHLATHGLLQTVKGDIPGAIALAPSGSDNGLLAASEVFDLSMSAKLAVLSACDTGRGAITGDGVVGLSRSFIAAGVPSVVVSLWPVNDQSTKLLMEQFYQGLNRGLTKAQALREAMLETMKRYPDPNYWAAFTLIGESDRL